MWNKRGIRGNNLETLIERTNEYYLKNNVARIDKAATPVKVTEISSSGKILEGYFEKKSTVDFYGVAQGNYIAFDAKETQQKSLPLKNIHIHQLEYMRDVTKQGGIAFVIVNFVEENLYYLLPYEVVNDYFINAKNGGRKSIPKSAFINELQITISSGYLLNYLEVVNNYLDWRKDYYS